jgi:ADP-heptose:LPS heptosyltransferase
LSKLKNKIKNEWINPIGGLGDMLMLSGVLKLVHEANPQTKYNLVRRTQYTQVLKGHPAIHKIGFPTNDDKIIHTDYWNKEKIGAGKQRAFQIMARIFGMETPVEETLFLPSNNGKNQLLHDNIPWKKKNIILAPYSNSPRKTMHPIHWHQLIEKLVENKDVFVAQTGLIHEMHIKNTFSLLGVTNLRDLVSLVRKSDLVISSDSLMMHISHLVNTPAVVIWGPTSADTYGYDNQCHFTAPVEKCNLKNECLGADYPDNYQKPCPLNDSGHCMNKININELYTACNKILN